MSQSLKSLDQLGYVSRGRSRHRPRDAEHLYGGPYPFIQTADVKRADLYITEWSQTYSVAGLAQSRMWSAGTLCISIAANIAETAILGIDACFPDSVIGFIPDEDKADARFIKYMFDAFLQRSYQQFTQGATQDNLSQEKLLSIKFPVPDIHVQKRVADILCAYDLLIENNRRRMELLEDAARQLYREWFVRLRFPGSEHTPIRDGLPEGWAKVTAFEAMEVLSGGTPKTEVSGYWDGEIPFYTPKDASDACYAITTARAVTEVGLKNCNSRLYPKDTVFISARGTVGKLNLAYQPMAMSQSCYALIGKGHVSQLFLYSALKESISYLKQQAAGAVFDAIVVDTFKRIPFMLPDERIARLFEQNVAPVFSQIGNLSEQKQRLRAARDLLLPRLMSGEIQV